MGTWRRLNENFFSIQSRKVTKRTVKERAAKVLELVQKCAKYAPDVSVYCCFCRYAEILKLSIDFGWRRD